MPPSVRAILRVVAGCAGLPSGAMVGRRVEGGTMQPLVYRRQLWVLVPMTVVLAAGTLVRPRPTGWTYLMIFFLVVGLLIARQRLACTPEGVQATLFRTRLVPWSQIRGFEAGSTWRVGLGSSLLPARCGRRHRRPGGRPRVCTGPRGLGMGTTGQQALTGGVIRLGRLRPGSPFAAKDCQAQLSATPLRCTSPWRPLARLNSPSVTEAGLAHARGWIDRQCVGLGCQ